MRFSNLSGSDVSQSSTAVYTFYDLPGEPWILVKPGGDLNLPYFQAVLASQTKNRRKLQKGKIDAEMLVKNRNVDRSLYPIHLDGGEWGGWLDDETGEEVPYSKEGFKDLMAQLPGHLFDGLRAFCNEPMEFATEDEPDSEDIEETAGN
tara:strand:+ start:491 stop:937 length:447 start_codon:yes stop_codon:yes gene_type:complete